MKKKAWYTILLLLLFPKAYCQKPDSLYRDDFSFEADANYYRYLTSETFSNILSYGFSFHAAKYIDKVKLSLGINYSVKHLKSDEQWFPYNTSRREYRLEYTNVPILIGITTVSRKHFASAVLAGVIIVTNTKYEITSYYFNAKSVTENAKAKGLKDNNLQVILGNTFSIPLEGSKSYHGRFVLNLLPFAGLKAKYIFAHPKNTYLNVPGDKIMFGFKVGLEYVFQLHFKSLGEH